MPRLSAQHCKILFGVIGDIGIGLAWLCDFSRAGETQMYTALSFFSLGVGDKEFNTMNHFDVLSCFNRD